MCMINNKPDGSEFQTEGTATLKPREAKVVIQTGYDMLHLSSKAANNVSSWITVQ